MEKIKLCVFINAFNDHIRTDVNQPENRRTGTNFGS